MSAWIGSVARFEWPFSESEESKSRPVLIVSEPDDQGDVMLLKLTEKSHYAGAVKIEHADLSAGELAKTSYVRIDRAMSVHRSQITLLGVRLKPDKIAEIFRAMTLASTRGFSALKHQASLPANPLQFKGGETTVPYAGRVFDANEVEAAVASSLDFWLTLGKEGEEFEREFAKVLGVKRTILVNSGSSANLLAFSALTSAKLPAERRVMPGDEVITAAAGFPTTVAPIIQNDAVPVFIDNDPRTLNARPEMLEAAYSPGKTKAVMMAHTLGNPFDLSAVVAFCKKYNLWLIEDNCDALGATYTFPQSTIRNPELTGTFGDLSTQSFYPPHHLTLGEGGAVNIVRDMKFKVLVESFRDWGRDCWCASGVDNTCGKRFGWQLGDLPEGYDHKYIYSHLGYNLKPLDIQAAIGREQLKKLTGFIEARRSNWQYLRRGLADLEEFFDFNLPTHATRWTPDGFEWDASGAQCDPSWFGFMLLVKEGAPFSRVELGRHLDEHRIGNRTLFGGNLVRQPAFTQLLKDKPGAFRVVGELGGADTIMNRVIFVGVYPGLSQAMLDYMVETVRGFVTQKAG